MSERHHCELCGDDLDNGHEHGPIGDYSYLCERCEKKLMQQDSQRYPLAAKPKSNQGVIVATGGWNSTKLKALPCKESPRGRHFMKDVGRKPSPNKGETLITSECKHCGCRIVDCPTIGISEFTI